ncbi:MAG: DUF433 domain-containing protein [Thermomicrobiales bacterium]
MKTRPSVDALREYEPPTDEQLVARRVERDRIHGGLGDVRLRGSGIPVWSIVGAYLVNGRNAAETAAAFGIPLADVEAGLAFYGEFGWAIDARLLQNDDSLLPLLDSIRF